MFRYLVTVLLSRSHSSFPYHADPDVMQSYASQYPVKLEQTA